MATRTTSKRNTKTQAPGKSRKRHQSGSDNRRAAAAGQDLAGAGNANAAEQHSAEAGDVHSIGGVRRAGTGRSIAPAKTAGRTAPKPPPRRESKQSVLVGLLQCREGATLAEMVDATGWQSHSVRGAISFAIKKKLGHIVTSDLVQDRGRVYRIVAATCRKPR